MVPVKSTYCALNSSFPRKRQGCPGKIEEQFVWAFCTEFASKSPLPGLVPGIHVLRQRQSLHRRRGWPDQVRPRGSSLVAQDHSLATASDSPDSPAWTRGRVGVGAGTEASNDAGGKGGGERAILLIAVYPEDLVQGAPR